MAERTMAIMNHKKGTAMRFDVYGHDHLVHGAQYISLDDEAVRVLAYGAKIVRILPPARYSVAVAISLLAAAIITRAKHDKKTKPKTTPKN